MGQYRTSIDLLVQNWIAKGDPFVEEIYNRIFSNGEFSEETFGNYFKNYFEKAVEVNHPVLKNQEVMQYVYLYAEEYELFFIELEKYIKTEGSSIGPLLLKLPFYDPVRDDPRFVKLWERSGLSKYYK